jgi:hypothetical protein
MIELAAKIKLEGFYTRTATYALNVIARRYLFGCNKLDLLMNQKQKCVLVLNVDISLENTNKLAKKE